MLVVNFEQVHPALVQLFLLVSRQSGGIGVILLLELEVLLDAGTTKALGVGQHIDVKFRNQHLHATGCKGIDALLVLIEVGIVQSVVALHTHAIDAQTFGLQVLDQTADSFALLLTRHGVVVIVELSVGVSLMSCTEGYLNEFLAQ